MKGKVTMRRDFWRGKNVFLTGHTGFKGSWASLWLHDMGAKVHGYSLPPPTTPSLFQDLAVESFCHNTIDDILNYKKLRQSMIDARPDVVIHMAAQPLVRASYEAPIETFATNVMGTVHVLEALKSVPSAKSAVIVTTDKCYENVEHDVGYTEDEAMGGYDPYSASKGCAELVVSAMRRSFFQDGFLAIGSARAGNVIGGGDWAKDRLIPDMIKHFYEEKSVLIRNPLAIRPWQHVLEPLSGYFTLAEKLYEDGQDFAEAWNFGPFEKEARNVGYIADELVKMWGQGSSWRRDTTVHPHEAKYLKLNIDKAMKKLEWSPRLNIQQTLQMTVDWYKQYPKNKKQALEITLGQIKEFESRKQ